MNNGDENTDFETEIELLNALLMVHRMSLWVKSVSLSDFLHKDKLVILLIFIAFLRKKFYFLTM